MFRFFSIQILFTLCFASFLLSSCQQQKRKINLVAINDTTTSVSVDSISKPALNYAFQLQLKSGDRYNYTINNTMDTHIEYANQKVNTSTTSTVELLYQVISDTANQYRIKITYKKIHIKSKRSDATEEMDADNNYSLNPNEKVLSGLKDQSVYITISKKGELKSVTGYNEMAAHALSQVQITDENQRKEMQTQLSNILGESFIKANLTTEGTLFPHGSLEEGDTWTKNTSQAMPFPVSGTTHYEVESLSDDVVVISAKSDLESGGKSTTMMGTEVTTNVKGKSKTNYRLQTKIGMVMNEDATTNLEGNMQVMGRDVPLTVAIEKTVDVKKL